MSDKLSAPLLSTEDVNAIELLNHESDTNMQETYQQYQRFREQGGNLHNIQHEIITKLGGIDNILNNCLTSQNPLKLTNKEISDINNLFSTKIHSKQSSTNNDTLYLNVYDSLSNHICGRSFGNKLVNFTLHKYSLYALIFSFIIALIFSNIMNFNPNVSSDEFSWQAGICYIFGVITFLYLISLLFCVNEFIIPYIVSSFEFWLKILYCFKYSLFHFTYTVYHESPSKSAQRALFSLVALLVMISFVSMLDGLKMDRPIKIFLNMMLALYLSYSAFEWQLLTPLRADISFRAFGNTLSVNSSDMIGDAYTMLSVFVWKQTIMTIVRKTRTTMITRGYKIKWIQKRPEMN